MKHIFSLDCKSEKVYLRQFEDDSDHKPVSLYNLKILLQYQKVHKKQTQHVHQA